MMEGPSGRAPGPSWRGWTPKRPIPRGSAQRPRGWAVPPPAPTAPTTAASPFPFPEEVVPLLPGRPCGCSLLLLVTAPGHPMAVLPPGLGEAARVLSQERVVPLPPPCGHVAPRGATLPRLEDVPALPPAVTWWRLRLTGLTLRPRTCLATGRSLPGVGVGETSLLWPRRHVGVHPIGGTVPISAPGQGLGPVAESRHLLPGTVFASLNTCCVWPATDYVLRPSSGASTSGLRLEDPLGARVPAWNPRTLKVPKQRGSNGHALPTGRLRVQWP